MQMINMKKKSIIDQISLEMGLNEKIVAGGISAVLSTREVGSLTLQQVNFTILLLKL